jgi:hypothetical protein
MILTLYSTVLLLTVVPYPVLLCFPGGARLMGYQREGKHACISLLQTVDLEPVEE